VRHFRKWPTRQKGMQVTWCSCNMGWQIYFQLTIFNHQQEQSGAEVFQISILTATPAPLAVIWFAY
jgi:hypothetical protein